jgi:tetratricopeptide (TPR) repeat protein
MAYRTHREGARFGSPRRWVAASLSAAIVACTSFAVAQTSTDDLARTHFESGAAYLEQADYDAALREFKEAYKLSQRPEILINIATVDERLGDLDAAIAALEQYLTAAPTGEHAEIVKVRLANLKERKSKVESSKKSSEPAAAPAPTPAPSAPAATTLPPAQADQTSAAPSKIPAYALFAVAGVTAAGSILTGILAQGEHSDLEDSCAPHCTEDQVATGKTLALTSTILTGVAVVTGAVGAVLFFNESSQESAKHRGPQVGVAVGPAAGLAQARWRF